MRTRGEAHREAHEMILETASELVFRGGLENLSLLAIARELGFGPASLYGYFDSKEAILDTLGARAAESLRGLLKRVVTRLGDDRSMLTALGVSYVRWARTNPEDFLFLCQLLLSRRQSTKRQARSTSSVHALFVEIAEAVQRAHQAGAMSGETPGSTVHLAFGLWAMAHGLALLQVTRRPTQPADLEATERALFDALTAGWR